MYNYQIYIPVRPKKSQSSQYCSQSSCPQCKSTCPRHWDSSGVVGMAEGLSFSEPCWVQAPWAPPVPPRVTPLSPLFAAVLSHSVLGSPSPPWLVPPLGRGVDPQPHSRGLSLPELPW